MAERLNWGTKVTLNPSPEPIENKLTAGELNELKSVIDDHADEIENIVVGSTDWVDVTNKPTEFPPSAHNHVESDISDLDKYSQSEVDDKISEKTNVDGVTITGSGTVADPFVAVVGGVTLPINKSDVTGLVTDLTNISNRLDAVEVVDPQPRTTGDVVFSTDTSGKWLTHEDSVSVDYTFNVGSFSTAGTYVTLRSLGSSINLIAGANVVIEPLLNGGSTTVLDQDIITLYAEEVGSNLLLIMV